MIQLSPQSSLNFLERRWQLIDKPVTSFFHGPSMQNANASPAISTLPTTSSFQAEDFQQKIAEFTAPTYDTVVPQWLTVDPCLTLETTCRSCLKTKSGKQHPGFNKRLEVSYFGGMGWKCAFIQCAECKAFRSDVSRHVPGEIV